MKQAGNKAEKLPLRELSCRANDLQKAIILAALPYSSHRTRNAFILSAALDEAKSILRAHSISEAQVLAQFRKPAESHTTKAVVVAKAS